MKWIGQHIWSFISRFRNDVYLEAVDTSTETDMLVVDSAGKVTKRAIDAITVDVSDFMTNGVDNRVLTATGADAMNAEANFTFTGSLATITGSTKMISDSPLLMHTDGNADDYHQLSLGSNGDITWTSVDAAAANASLNFNLDGQFNVDAASTMTLNPTGLLKTTATGVEIENASDSGVTALIIDNNDADETGLRIAGSNTIAAGLLIDSIPLTTGKLLYVQHVSLHTTGHDSNLSFIQYSNIGVLGSGQTQNIKGHYVACIDLATNHASSTKTITGIDVDVSYSSAQGTTSATGINLLTTGADTNTGIDMTTTDGGADIILRSSADTGDTCIIRTTTHGATRIATTDDDAAAAHIEIAADGNITLDAAGDITLNVDSDNNTTNNNVVFQDNGTVGFSYNVGRAAMDMESVASGYPYIQMNSTSDDGNGSVLTFKKSRTDSSIQIGEVGDGLGTINWSGYNDGTPALKKFAQITSTIADPVTGAEAGDLTIKVASYDGVLTDGLKLHGDTNADGEVDVTIGAGAASVTTIAGNLTSTAEVGILNNNYLKFYDSDNSHTTRVKSGTASTNRTITLPDADGTVQLQGSNAGQTFSVPLKVDDLYVLYVSTQNHWYHTGIVGNSLGTSIGSELDHAAMRAVSYVAHAACKVNKVTVAFYSTGSADLEFQVTKIPLVDNSNSNVTLAAMTHNDINFSMAANYNYVKTMTMTGDSSDNALSAGQAFTLAIRRTDATGTRTLYGNCFAEIELT